MSAKRHKDPRREAPLLEPPLPALISEGQWEMLREKYGMTPREVQVVKLLCRGMNHREIAEAVGTTPGTAKTHIRNVYRRVHVKSNMALLVRFIEESNELRRGHEGDGWRRNESQTSWADG